MPEGKCTFLSFSEAAAEKKHVMFGRPRMLQPDHSYCVLHQDGFIMAFSHDALMPVWSSFTIDRPVREDIQSARG